MGKEQGWSLSQFSWSVMNLTRMTTPGQNCSNGANRKEKKKASRDSIFGIFLYNDFLSCFGTILKIRFQDG